MRTGLAFKILFRAPIRTALTLVLLGAAAFALFSQAAEFAVLRREVNAAASRYRGTGFVEASPPKPRAKRARTSRTTFRLRAGQPDAMSC